MTKYKASTGSAVKGLRTLSGRGQHGRQLCCTPRDSTWTNGAEACSLVKRHGIATCRCCRIVVRIRRGSCRPARFCRHRLIVIAVRDHPHRPSTKLATWVATLINYIGLYLFTDTGRQHIYIATISTIVTFRLYDDACIQVPIYAPQQRCTVARPLQESIAKSKIRSQ